ncbi:hypothetical protein HYH02_010758 [Chlamydomonas schloesseri]|uniref:Protein kinase domain-containing protein n=1 Tax=Chlamydomonas schloesseri TaxID=2026947 RepID=A0A835TIG1_9CHLO|nr:hypothetical protein HYH02_010758 [Chlamydomonas schloesseri]|eukprot:KAG2438966.1 hypothetical protein HYH02_010758 [Chlamydomonas schloesseri]
MAAKTPPLPVLDPVSNYEKLHRIGEGTYGVVYKARDRTTGEIVALKRVRFDRSRDGVPVTSVRELRVLQACRHPNIVQLKKVVTGSQADSVFLVFEYCDHDLGRLLDSMAPPAGGGGGGTARRPFSISEVKGLMRQLLEAVSFLHDHWVVHRDIKVRPGPYPSWQLDALSNLLYTHTGHLKLCDFGLARFFSPFVAKDRTPNVVTLWYRAPEVLLGSEEYDESIDLWSCGAILAELLTGEPLFPAASEAEALNMMANLLGAPGERIWPGMSALPNAAKFVFPAQPYNFLRRHMAAACTASGGGLSEAGLALLNGLLTYDPARRITARQALRHDWFQEKPYPKQPGDMPTFPSSHDGGRASGHHHGHHHHHHAGGGAAGGGAVGGKRALSEAAVGLLAEAKRQALGRAGAVGAGGGGGLVPGLDDRFGAAFGGGGGGGGGFGAGWGGGASSGLLEGSGVQLVRK